MVKEEGGDLDEEEWLKRKDHPLSPADWIVFLGGEISNCRKRSLTCVAMILAVMLACLSGTITLLGRGVLELIASYILAAFVIVLSAVLFLHGRHVTNEIRPLSEIREDIICGKLKNYEDILKQCEDAGIFKCHRPKSRGLTTVSKMKRSIKNLISKILGFIGGGIKIITIVGVMGILHASFFL